MERRHGVRQTTQIDKPRIAPWHPNIYQQLRPRPQLWRHCPNTDSTSEAFEHSDFGNHRWFPQEVRVLTTGENKQLSDDQHTPPSYPIGTMVDHVEQHEEGRYKFSVSNPPLPGWFNASRLINLRYIGLSTWQDLEPEHVVHETQGRKAP